MPKKRGGGGSGMGGLKNAISSGVVLILIVSGLVGWVKVNNISSVSDGFNYIKSWSEKIQSCGARDLEWNCRPDSGGNGTPVVPAPKETPGSGTAPGQPAPANPAPEPAPGTGIETPKNEMFAALDRLTIGDEQKVKYERSSWKHWTGSPCDTREVILFQQGSNVSQDPTSCKAVSGNWTDPYSGNTFTNASDLDIDHVIPLGFAAKHGGQDWSAEKKQQFANDTTQLLAVSAKENRSKSDKGPASYMPKNKDFHCDYSKIWISTASKYGITISNADKTELKIGLQKCSN